MTPGQIYYDFLFVRTHAALRGKPIFTSQKQLVDIAAKFRLQKNYANTQSTVSRIMTLETTPKKKLRGMIERAVETKLKSKPDLAKKLIGELRATLAQLDEKLPNKAKAAAEAMLARSGLTAREIVTLENDALAASTAISFLANASFLTSNGVDPFHLLKGLKKPGVASTSASIQVLHHQR